MYLQKFNRVPLEQKQPTLADMPEGVVYRVTYGKDSELLLRIREGAGVFDVDTNGKTKACVGDVAKYIVHAMHYTVHANGDGTPITGVHPDYATVADVPDGVEFTLPDADAKRFNHGKFVFSCWKNGDVMRTRVADYASRKPTITGYRIEAEWSDE